MGGRGTFAAGNSVEYRYEKVGEIKGVKVLFGKKGTGIHDLPVESHSSNMYIKLNKDGSLNMLRVYDKDHYLVMEIAFHPEPALTGNREPVLHVHYYNRSFLRSKPQYIDYETFKKYEQYLVGRKWYYD